MACPAAFEAQPFCQGGVCVLACEGDAADCNGLPEDGCEVDLEEDLQNCGACGWACVEENGVATCYDGACLFACEPDFEDCDGLPANGCEADLQSDPTNCGACGIACPGPCAAGSC